MRFAPAFPGKAFCTGSSRAAAGRVAFEADAGFVRFLVAACRTQLAVTSALWARAERDSYCDSKDNYGSYRRLVLERPSRDADGVPLLSRSEIDRVLPAIFGVDIVWAALATALLVGALATYACFTKTDFTGCGLYLFVVFL